VSGFRSCDNNGHRRSKAKDLRPRYAFTLLELMLVAAIILALVLLSTPIFRRTYEDLQLTTSAKNIAYMANFCRERAVFERIDYRLNIDTDNNVYQISVRNEEDNTFKPLKEKWGRSFRIPNGIEVKTDKEAIDFSPEGDTNSFTIYLTNKENKTIVVSIKAGTGSIRIYDYIEE